MLLHVSSLASRQKRKVTLCYIELDYLTISAYKNWKLKTAPIAQDGAVVVQL